MSYLQKLLHAEDPNAPVGTPNNPSHKILTVANAITVARIALTLVFLALFCMHANRILCLAIFAVAAITDFLDGLIARKTHTVSWFGKLLDPIVDRFLIFTGVVGLFVVGEFPLWIPIFLIARDGLLALGMFYIKRIKHRPLDVLILGKVTTALLLVGFAWMLLGWPSIAGPHITEATWLPGLNGCISCAGIYLVYAGVICSAITFALYIAEGIAATREVKRNA